jgi:nucleotide-binding universal stress UspA family protein
MSEFAIGRILVPTDFSRTSERALRYAIGLARAFGSEITLLHVFDTRVVENVFHIHQLTPERAREEMQRSAEERMDRLRESAGTEGVPVAVRYAEGLPPRVVQETAEEIRADLIVMGTHGETGLAQLLYGATAEGVVRGAPCPVLTVNP